MKVIAVVVFNQLFLSVPLQALFLPLYLWRGLLPTQSLELPPPTVVVRDLVVMILVEEVLFYYSHRLLHGLFESVQSCSTRTQRLTNHCMCVCVACD